MRFFYKRVYLKAFDSLNHPEQELALKTDSLIKKYLLTSQAPFGLRVKKLQPDIYEGRLNDRLRIVWVKEGDEITFALLGNHEEVQRFLKRF